MWIEWLQVHPKLGVVYLELLEAVLGQGLLIHGHWNIVLFDCQWINFHLDFFITITILVFDFLINSLFCCIFNCVTLKELLDELRILQHLADSTEAGCSRVESECDRQFVIESL